MVGAYIKFLRIEEPQRAIVLKLDGWRALVDVVDCKPFVEYCNGGQPSTHYNNVGWVAKRRLFGLRSTRISEGISVHDITVSLEHAEVLNGQTSG